MASIGDINNCISWFLLIANRSYQWLCFSFNLIEHWTLPLSVFLFDNLYFDNLYWWHRLSALLLTKQALFVVFWFFVAACVFVSVTLCVFKIKKNFDNNHCLPSFFESTLKMRAYWCSKISQLTVLVVQLIFFFLKGSIVFLHNFFGFWVYFLLVVYLFICCLKTYCPLIRDTIKL